MIWVRQTASTKPKPVLYQSSGGAMGRVRSKQVKSFSGEECKDLTAWVTEDEASAE